MILARDGSDSCLEQHMAWAGDVFIQVFASLDFHVEELD
jgi:hypothetical protein